MREMAAGSDQRQQSSLDHAPRYIYLEGVVGQGPGANQGALGCLYRCTPVQSFALQILVSRAGGVRHRRHAAEDNAAVRPYSAIDDPDSSDAYKSEVPNAALLVLRNTPLVLASGTGT